MVSQSLLLLAAYNINVILTLNFKKQRTHAHYLFVQAFPARSPRILPRNKLTERDWEYAVQGLGSLQTSPISFAAQELPVQSQTQKF